MLTPLLSILLMGMIPMPSASVSPEMLREYLTVSSPSPLTAQSILRKVPGRVSASGYVLLDLQSGQVIEARSAQRPTSIGSLTKLMTALIITEHHGLDEVVTIPWGLDIEGTVAHLPPGHRFTVGDLLSALLIGSANDAADVLARYHSGSVDAFTDEMNRRAVSLGLKHTVFQNPSGLDAYDQWSTPQDVAWLASFVLRRPAIRSRMSKQGVTIASLEGEQITLTHTHALLHTEPTILAGKTGTTVAAGQCLLSVVEAEGREVLVVLLNSSDRYSDMRRILSALSKLAL